MSKKRLASSKTFFAQVLKPNFDAFMNSSSSFQTTINMVTSLYHMHEWIFKTDKTKAEIALGQTFSTAFEIWEAVETAVPRAGFIRDVANASKHVTLNNTASTSMTHVANTYIMNGPGFGQGNYGASRYSGSVIKMEDGGGDVLLDDAARDVFIYWEALIKKL